MQTSSDSTPPKRTRAKAKSDSPKPTVTVKKSRARKATAVQEVTGPEAQAEITRVEAVQWSEEQIREMIAMAAYYIAAERGFGPGREVDDWLEAERRICALCFG